MIKPKVSLMSELINSLTEKLTNQTSENPQSPKVKEDHRWQMIKNENLKSIKLFQLKYKEEFAPELLILIPAGRDVRKPLEWFHTIYESAYDVQPNGQYATLRADEIAEKYGISMKELACMSENKGGIITELAVFLGAHLAETNRISPFARGNEIVTYFEKLLDNFFYDQAR